MQELWLLGGWVEIYMECVYSYFSLHEEGGGGGSTGL